MNQHIVLDCVLFDAMRCFVLVFSQFQFVWLSDPETGSNIIMGSRDLPYFFVLDPQTHHYYLPNATEMITTETLIEFLEGTIEGRFEVSQVALILIEFGAPNSHNAQG